MSAKRRSLPPSAEAATLDRASPIPLYVQVRNRLLAMVGGWTDPEKRFYSDDELTGMFGVSRATVREALAELVEAGVLRRTRGRGTAVSLRKVEEKLTPGMNIRSQWEAEGRPISASVLASSTRARPSGRSGCAACRASSSASAHSEAVGAGFSSTPLPTASCGKIVRSGCHSG